VLLFSVLRWFLSYDTQCAHNHAWRPSAAVSMKKFYTSGMLLPEDDLYLYLASFIRLAVEHGGLCLSPDVDFLYGSPHVSLDVPQAFGEHLFCFVNSHNYQHLFLPVSTRRSQEAYPSVPACVDRSRCLLPARL